MIKKANNARTKASLQSPFKIKDINSKYSKGYKVLVKKKDIAS